MAILVSPGVSVTITDESQYGPAGPGTVPLLVIATAQDKIQPGSTTSIAPGTTKANSGKLWLITSQRDAITTFGAPTFYSSSGSQQYDNQLNELGLFTLYEYLGIANRAYVLRADLDLGQLIPTANEPMGPPVSGQNWLDLSSTRYGIFRSNGNINPAFTWHAATPLVISSSANLEKIVQGYRTSPSKITSAYGALISSTGNLVINGIAVELAANDSITTVVSKINSSSALQLKNISSVLYARTEKISNTASTTGDVYSLRLVTTDVADIDLSGSDAGILSDLGLVSSPTNIVLPASGYGVAGDFAVNTLADVDGNYKNQIWEKISLTTTTGTRSWWFKVGSTDSSYAGWGWKSASPRVITGDVVNPTFTPGDTCTIKIGSSGILTVTVPGGGALADFVSAINTQLNSGGGTTAVASVYQVGSQKYLRITNYASTDITLNDLSDQYGTGHPWKDAGIYATNTYWASVTGTVANPTFTAATLKTGSATVIAPGTGYNVADALTCIGGTFTSASILTVASVQVVGVTPSTNPVGSLFQVNDKLTFSGAGFDTSVILNVDSIDGPGGGITGLSIVQAGQYTGAVAPTTSVAPTTTSGNGINATVDLVWGVNTVTVTTPGSYTIYPTDPVATSGGSGTATFDLTPDWLQSTSFNITVGGTTVTTHVPALPDNTLSGVIAEINNVSWPNGPIVASATTDNKLKLTNTNGTSFTVEDLRATPLGDAGIAAGVTYGRQLFYQGYQPSLTVPSDLSQLALDNIWINTTSGNQGANWVVKSYVTETWRKLNIHPNTGTVPMYASTAAADAGFGGLKQIGSVFVQYNSDGDSPVEANHVIKRWDGSSWVTGNDPNQSYFTYTPSVSEPEGPPVDGTLWYNTRLRADIMVNDGTQWLGYKLLYPATDPNGVLLSSTEPTTQSTLAPLVDYDLWIDTNEVNYPKLYRYDALNANWVAVDNTDQSTSAGIIFADARPNADGTATGSELTSAMVLSSYVDPDAPDALLYPAGMLLFNTRYSTNNVKEYQSKYMLQYDTTNTWPQRWVTVSGNSTDGSPYMGKYAQRRVVVNALQAVLANSEAARAEQTYFNLLATPGYPECLDEMITLNTDKKEVAFIVADTPAHLESTGTAFVNWANNAANAADNGDLALISHSPYSAVYYPWGLGTNLDGASVFVPPSLMALRTYAYNDQVAYPWFAPAGFNRGLVTGVSSVGYLNNENDYVPVTLNQGQRDVLYTNSINPIAYIPGRGLVIYGQKTLNPVASALDRVNVARLICDLKYNLDNLAKPFLFEPNDKQTRDNVVQTFRAFMNNYKTLRAVYDYAVVCDESNNTPERIDRNELWIDIAIKPEKAIEFIYIPIRILNTGDPLPGGTQG